MASTIQDILEGRTKMLPFPIASPVTKQAEPEAPFPTPEDSIHDDFDAQKSPTPAQRASSTPEIDPPLYSPASISRSPTHYIGHTPQDTPPATAWHASTPPHHWPATSRSPPSVGQPELLPTPVSEDSLTLPPIKAIPPPNLSPANRPQPIEPQTAGSYAVPHMWRSMNNWNNYSRSTVDFNAKYGIGPGARRPVAGDGLNVLADVASLAPKQQPLSRNAGPPRTRKATPKKRAAPIDLPAPRAQRTRKRANLAIETDEAPIRRRQRTERRDKPPHWTQIWSQLAKYLPPVEHLSTLEPSVASHRLLPSNGYTTKASSLDNDPDRSVLHPWEVELCERIRLTANLYMSLKLRIFEARYKRLGQNWSKTHAQAVGTVDVNKISTLWEVFHRVGWDRAEFFSEDAVAEREAKVLRNPVIVRDS